MTAITQNNILFDDFALLKELIGAQRLNLSSPTTDCDCISYTAPINDDNVNTNQVAPSTPQAN